MTKPLTDVELAKIEARAKAATPEPWSTEALSNGEVVIHSDVGGYPVGVIFGARKADFIASARSDVPRLLTEVRRLNARVAELERLNSMGFFQCPSCREYEKLVPTPENNCFHELCEYCIKRAEEDPYFDYCKDCGGPETATPDCRRCAGVGMCSERPCEPIPKPEGREP